MPFSLKNFQPAAGTQVGALAPALHTYVTTDTHATVATAGYFNAVRDILNIGDLVYVSVLTGGGALSTAGFHVVRTKTATSVDVTDVTALVVTNAG